MAEWLRDSLGLGDLRERFAIGTTFPHITHPEIMMPSVAWTLSPAPALLPGENRPAQTASLLIRSIVPCFSERTKINACGPHSHCANRRAKVVDLVHTIGRLS